MSDAKTVRARALELVLQVLRDTNARRAANAQVPVQEDVRLVGKSSALDSLELVNVLLDVEERAQRAFGKAVVLMDEKAMAQQSSPFRTPAALADYIASLAAKGS